LGQGSGRGKKNARFSGSTGIPDSNNTMIHPRPGQAVLVDLSLTERRFERLLAEEQAVIPKV
jgi:hypothetical protein